MPVRIAYVVAEFPSVTELFILRELKALHNLGFAVQVFALHLPANPDAVPASSRVFLDRTTYFPPLTSPQLWRQSLGTFFHCFPASLRELCFLCSRSLHPPLFTPHFSRFSLLRWHLRHFPSALWLASQIRRHKVTHVHAHFAHVTSSIAMVAASLCRIPFTLSVHAYDLYVEPVLLQEKLDRAAAVITCTQANKNFLLSFFCVQPEKVHLIYHGLPLNEFANKPSTQKPKAPTVLFVGRLVKKKGVDILLQAARRLMTDGVKFRCLIIGDGPLRQELKELAMQLGLRGIVEFIGELPHEQVKRFYAEADVLSVPSIIDERGDRDGLPNVILEAAACGLPVVASQVSAISEFVEHGKTGWLVPPGDANALAAMLRQAWENQQQAKQVADAARRKVEEHFDLQRNIEALLKVITGRD